MTDQITPIVIVDKLTPCVTNQSYWTDPNPIDTTSHYSIPYDQLKSIDKLPIEITPHAYMWIGPMEVILNGVYEFYDRIHSFHEKSQFLATTESLENGRWTNFQWMSKSQVIQHMVAKEYERRQEMKRIWCAVIVMLIFILAFGLSLYHKRSYMESQLADPKWPELHWKFASICNIKSTCQRV